jgi:hypothetical protein
MEEVGTIFSEFAGQPGLFKGQVFHRRRQVHIETACWKLR